MTLLFLSTHQSLSGTFVPQLVSLPMHVRVDRGFPEVTLFYLGRVAQRLLLRVNRIMIEVTP